MKKNLKKSLLILFAALLSAVASYLCFFIMHHTYDAPQGFYSRTKILGIVFGVIGVMALTAGIILLALSKQRRNES